MSVSSSPRALVTVAVAVAGTDDAGPLKSIVDGSAFPSGTFRFRKSTSLSGTSNGCADRDPTKSIVPKGTFSNVTGLVLTPPRKTWKASPSERIAADTATPKTVHSAIT